MSNQTYESFADWYDDVIPHMDFGSHRAMLKFAWEAGQRETQAAWEADSSATLEVTILLRAVAAEALEWRAGYPGEVRENLDAAIRSDWAYLRRRFTPEYIESLLDREDAK